MEEPKTSRWKVHFASVAGVSHERVGLTCQDSVKVIRVGDIICIAIADGAGSAEYAELASKVAVRSALMTLASMPPIPSSESATDMMLTAMHKSKAALLRAAGRRNVRPRDFATTLSLFVLAPTFTVAVQVGDGGSVAYTETKSAFTLLAPARGEYTNETQFLHDADITRDLKFASVPEPVTFMVAFTDGLLPVAMTQGASEPFKPFTDSLKEFWASGNEGRKEGI